MRRSLITMAALFAATAATAFAELQEGEKPQAMGADAKYINCDEFDFVKLRSKVVLLQLAHTKSDPSKEQIAKLLDLRKKYAEAGLQLVTVFEEPTDVVQAFVDANKIDYPVVANVGDLRDRWGVVKGFPTTYILDVQGKVAWSGNFADQAEVTIAALLKSVTDRPWLPTEYAAITAQLDAEQYGAARASLATALAAEAVLADDRGRLEAMVAWLDKEADKAFEEAGALRAKGNYLDVYEGYLAMAKAHAGSAAAEKAQAAADALMEDKSTKREIEGWRLFNTQFEAAKEIELKDRKKAISLLKTVVSRYRGTAAADRAAHLVDRLSE